MVRCTNAFVGRPLKIVEQREEEHVSRQKRQQLHDFNPLVDVLVAREYREVNVAVEELAHEPSQKPVVGECVGEKHCDIVPQMHFGDVCCSQSANSFCSMNQVKIY